MHNTLGRLQNVFSQVTSLAFILALIISALSLVPVDQYARQYFSSSSSPSSSPELQSPTAELSVRNIQIVRGRPHYYSKKREEYAFVRFDLEADLTPLFGWNTKQVFVYVGVEYPSIDEVGAEGKGLNKAIIWDTIIPAPESRWSVANIKRRWWPSAKSKTDATKRHPSQSPSSERTSGSTATGVTKPGLLVLNNQKPKYQISHPSGIISSRPNATLTLSWNVQPWVGPLLWDQSFIATEAASILEERAAAKAADIIGNSDHDVEGLTASALLSPWKLPFLRYQWKEQKQPRSEVFDFPALKAPGGERGNIDSSSGSGSTGSEQ